MKKLICKILGHNYSYNFGWMPNKCICKMCGERWKTISNPKYNGKNLLQEGLHVWIKDE